MMTTLFEEPGFAIVGGGILVVVMAIFWLTSGMRGFLIAGLAILVATFGLVLMEQMVVTDYEAVQETLQKIAIDAEKNDASLLYPYISSQTEKGEQLRAIVRSDFNSYIIDRITIDDNLKVLMFPKLSPPRAEATFTVFVKGSERSSGNRPPSAIPAAIKVTMFQEEGDWKIAEYDYKIGLRGYNSSTGHKAGRFRRVTQ